MANAQLYVNLAKSYFQRNNPVEMIISNAISTVYSLITLKSRMKLLQYRRMLEIQKLERIEHTLNQFNAYEHLGSKMNRTY